jgi:hypothetical protein
MIYKPEFEVIQKGVLLVDFSPGYQLGDFQCKDPDYVTWLVNDTPIYIDENLSQVKLLLNKENADIIGYIALCADSIELSISEKKDDGFGDVKIKSIPALKIGKLAIDIRYERRYYGHYLLWLALGIAQEMNDLGVACRYLSLDADISVSLTTDKFYEKIGFKYNKVVNTSREEKLKLKGEKLMNISMRYDIFEKIE